VTWDEILDSVGTQLRDCNRVYMGSNGRDSTEYRLYDCMAVRSK